MSLTRKIAINTIIQTAGRALALILGLISLAIMARYLGREGYGNFTTVIVFVQFFGIIADLGLSVILLQMTSEVGADKAQIFSNIFTFRFFSALILLGAAPIIVLFFPYPGIIKLGVLLAVGGIFFASLNQLLFGFFQKELKMMVVSIAEAVSRVVLIIFVVVAVYFDIGLTFILLATTLSAFIAFLINYFYSKKFVKLKFAFDWPLWREIFKRSWPVALAIVFNLIYLRADTLLLSLFKSQSTVGLYGAAYQVIDVLVVFPMMFMGLIMPIMSERWSAKNKEGFRDSLQQAFNAIVIFIVPLVVGTWFLAEKVMQMVAGSEFILSGNILRILIFGCGAVSLGTVFGYAIIAIGKQKKTIWVYALIAVTTLAGYLFFIPKYSYYGAAGMTVYSEVAVLILISLMFWRFVKIRPKFNILFKTILASLVMGVLLYFIQGWNLALVLILAITVYFASLYLLRGFSREMVREIISLKK